MNHEREPDQRLTRYLSGDMDAAERAAFETEVLQSDELAQQLYAEVNLDEALMPGVARTVRRGPAPAPRPNWLASATRWVVPLAAVVALAMFLPRLGSDDRGVGTSPVFRSDTTVTTLEPFGALDTPPTQFRWAGQAGVTRYRFELYDIDEMPVTIQITGETSVTVDDPAALARIAEGGMWKVVPLDPAGADLTASEPAWFTVLP